MAIYTSKKLPNKKVLLIVGIIIVVALSIIIGSLSDKTPSTQQVSNVKQLPPMTSYQGNSYTLAYPSDWTREKDGDSYLLQPPNAQKEGDAHVAVEIVDEKQTSMAQVTAGYTVFKYKKQSVTLPSGINAQRYSIVYPSTEGFLHSIAYVYEVNGKIYHFKLGYKSVNANPQLENEFLQIVNSFKINN